MSKASEDVKKPDESEAARKVASPLPDQIYIVPFPKVVFLYPTLFVAFIAATWMTILERNENAFEQRTAVTLAAFFLGTLAVNLFVLTMDFPRATSLTLFFVVATLILGIVLVAIQRPDFLPFLRGIFSRIRPVANSTFYWVVTVMLASVFVIVKIKVQFDYWEVRRNEILHHHGILSDLRRYPTAGLQVEKEINDVFEYVLMRSGRLIIRPAGENRAIVMDNVPRINTKEQQLTRLLSSVKVKFHGDD